MAAVVPGLSFLQPDYLENKDESHFLWGENQCTTDGGPVMFFLQML
ncbi:hypothetical protein [Flavobacterium sp. RS13.1]